MSSRITPEPRAADTHAGALDAALAGKAHLVYRIVLEVKRAPDGWRPCQRLNVANAEDDPLGPDEIRDELLSYIRDEQDANGPGKFRVSLFGRDKDGGEVRLAFVDSGLEPPATADVRATTEQNALVATNEMLRRHGEDKHKEYLALMKVAIEIPTTTVQVLKSMPEALGKSTAHYEMLTKALGYHYMDKDEERQSKERMDAEGYRQRRIDDMMGKLEPLAWAWLQKVMAEAGMDPPERPSSSGGASGPTVTQVVPPTAAKIRAFNESLTNDEKVKIMDQLGDDALAVLFGAADAPNEQTCLAVLRKLKDLLAEKMMSKESAIMALHSIVGFARVKDLAAILRPLWEET